MELSYYACESILLTISFVLLMKMCSVPFFRYSNGDTYEGYMQKGIRHGYGVLHASNADEMEIYFGAWQAGMRSGYGVSTNNSTIFISVKIHNKNLMLSN